LIERPRLTALLDQADAQAIVLCAPAGYGKTVLAAQWLAVPPRRGCCYVASPSGADVAAFAVDLAEAAASVVPGAGARVAERVRLGGSPHEAVEALAHLLADDLADWPEDAWLVLEDYHLLAGSPAIEALLDRLLELAPVRLLVTTRRRPGWATPRRILYGEVAELGREELAFTAEEAEAVVGPAREGLGELLEQAQGWPAIVGLAALASARSVPRASVAGTLFRYVADEVYRREPPDVQAAMLAAAVPPRVDTLVAAEVLGLPAPGVALERLEEEGLLAPAADGGLRFHPLIRGFLLRKLEAEDRARWEELHVRAVAHARAERRFDDAFTLARTAGRLDHAAEIVSEAAGPHLAEGRVETVERWLAALGDAGGDDVGIALARPEVLLRHGELFGAAELAERIATGLPDGDPRASVAWRLVGRGLQLLSEDARALTCQLRAADAATTRADRVAALRSAVALAADVDDARLEELVDRLADAAGDDLDARLQLVPARVFLASRRDSLAPLWRLAEALVERVDETPSPTTRTSFLRAASYLAVSRADYETGAALAERALGVCDEFRLGRIKHAFCLCSRAAADIGLRRLSHAEAALEELPAHAIEHTTVLLGERRTLTTKLLLARGDVERVLARGADGVAEQRALVALAAAAAGDARRARAEAEAARSRSALIETRFYAAYALLVARLATEGPTPEVGAAVCDLLERTAAAEMLDAFVFAYRACPQLLELLPQRPEALALVGPVTLRANDHVLARRAGVRPHAPAKNGERAVADLTPRESEVLALMVQGLGNRQIARRLFISEKTAKVHVGHIFDKLGVETRVQAVLAARDLLPPA
jgi:LuxR family maltose regulon positive regulatory protein